MSNIHYETLAEVATNVPHVAGIVANCATPPVQDLISENIKSVGQAIAYSEPALADTKARKLTIIKRVSYYKNVI